MSIQKKYFKSKSLCKVTFHLSKQKVGQAGKVTLAGEFNDWHTEKTPMKGLKNGDFSISLDLSSGREYQYRFVVDGEKWITDDCADKYANSGFGQSQNSVVVL
jgi:1,4-alpha-glucan branching enzyme